jgi:hypothetical protein
MSSVALAVWLAGSFTSVATTAKPTSAAAVMVWRFAPMPTSTSPPDDKNEDRGVYSFGGRAP